VGIIYLEIMIFLNGSIGTDDIEDDDDVDYEDDDGGYEDYEEGEFSEDVDGNNKLLSLAFACSAVLFVSSFIFNILHIYKCVN